MAKVNNNSNKNNGSYIRHDGRGIVNENASRGRLNHSSESRRPPHNPPKTGRGNSGNKK